MTANQSTARAYRDQYMYVSTYVYGSVHARK